jgi:CheY-like chemotaxis protein
MQTVLVIENDEANRENILKILRFKGFRGIGAKNGEMGVEFTQKYLPHVILCDISMPGLDGYGVLEDLGRLSATQHIPFVFMTAKADPTDVQYGLSLGVQGYLTKPFSSRELLEAIALCLTPRPAYGLPKAAATNSAHGYLSHKY